MIQRPANALYYVLSAVTLAWVSTSSVNAQTQEVHEGSSPLTMTAKEMDVCRLVLNTMLNMEEFHSKIDIREVLEELYDQLVRAQFAFSVMFNESAFREIGVDVTDVYKLPFQLSNVPSKMTVAEFLREVANQIPGRQAEVVIHPDWFEITTITNALENERFWARAKPRRGPLDWFHGPEYSRSFRLSTVGAPRLEWYLLGAVGVVGALAALIVAFRLRKKHI